MNMTRTNIGISPGQRAAARSFEPKARRATGRYCATDSLAWLLFAG
jgi:hypothetical protein